MALPNPMISLKTVLMIMMIGNVGCVWGQNGKHRVNASESKITIHGSTNINQFECTLEQKQSPDTVDVVSNWNDLRLKFSGLTTSYLVNNFECAIPGMNSDFQQILKSKEFPNLIFEVLEIAIRPQDSEIESLKVKAIVQVELAGVRKKLTIEQADVINLDDDRMIFSGSKVILMSDFGLVPPVRFFDLVKVNNELEINFEMQMTAYPK